MNNAIVISFTYHKCEYFSLSLLQTMEDWYMFLVCNFLITACNLKQCHEHVTINLCHYNTSKHEKKGENGLSIEVYGKND